MLFCTQTPVLCRNNVRLGQLGTTSGQRIIQTSTRVCLHYWLNRLQPLPFAQPIFVSLNPVRTINPAQILGEFNYHHPVFDLEAITAQQQVPQLQGLQHTWFAGAWTGYGFHEDGLQSGYHAADALLTQMYACKAA
jgi:predicted NAD/FAD-binding protein